jgi:rhodanese-related sulfurtransferase
MNKTITAQELRTRLNSGEAIKLIDVRSPGEYAAGHVPQAMNVPLEEVDHRIADFHGGQVAVLCQAGTRAGIACNMLDGRHDGLLLVQGGTDAWVAEGGELVGTSGSRWSLERQVRLAAGVLALTGSVLAVTVNPAWVYLSMFVGGGLTFAGITNLCPMAIGIAKLPWNQAKPCNSTSTSKVQA